MASFKEGEASITESLEEEVEYQKKRLDDLDRMLHGIEVKIRKLELKTITEVEKKEKAVFS